VPAADTPSSIPVSPSQKSDLLALLTTGPNAPSSPPKIHPRGLINTGNMCFANSVLQILIYCPPFYRLFAELGKYLTGPVVGAQKEGGKATPLVDATIEFLKEFHPVEADSKVEGKEVDREEEDGFESFIPTYVYDAMKEKKRFDNMRVRLYQCRLRIVLTCF
jgi:ubiquitin carboxyl-terminal hydrolase 10